MTPDYPHGPQAGDFDPSVPALYLPRQFAAGDLVTLPAEEERHARALRLREGDRVLLLNGDGLRASASVESLGRRDTSVRIDRTVLDGAEGRPYIVVAIGVLSDKSRFEWAVEKSVELGAREIIPIRTERSEGRIQAERLHRVAVAAMKQSQRSYLPRIPEPVSIGGLAERFGGFDRSFLCHESAPPEQTIARCLRDGASAQRILIMVGPEGGFSEQEAEQAREAGAAVVSLGHARLRAETAAIAALALVAGLADCPDAADGARAG